VNPRPFLPLIRVSSALLQKQYLLLFYPPFYRVRFGVTLPASWGFDTTSCYDMHLLFGHRFMRPAPGRGQQGGFRKRQKTNLTI